MKKCQWCASGIRTDKCDRCGGQNNEVMIEKSLFDKVETAIFHAIQMQQQQAQLSIEAQAMPQQQGVFGNQCGAGQRFGVLGASYYGLGYPRKTGY